MLREWIAQEADAEQYEIPAVEGSIPLCMRLNGMEAGELSELKDRIKDPLAAKLIEAVFALDRTSAQANRPELDDNIREQLSDCNPPLPCLLALFDEADAIAACFGEEDQGMLEVEPEPYHHPL